MVRLISSLLLTAAVTSLLGGCVVHEDRPHCPYGWEPEHRDRDGRLVGGHCR